MKSWEIKQSYINCDYIYIKNKSDDFECLHELNPSKYCAENNCPIRTISPQQLDSANLKYRKAAVILSKRLKFYRARCKECKLLNS